MSVVQALVGCGESGGLPMPDGKPGDGTGCELWTHPAGLDTDPVLELEFDQTANLAPEGSLKKIAAGFACRPRLYLICLVLVHAV